MSKLIINITTKDNIVFGLMVSSPSRDIGYMVSTSDTVIELDIEDGIEWTIKFRGKQLIIDADNTVNHILDTFIYSALNEE